MQFKCRQKLREENVFNVFEKIIYKTANVSYIGNKDGLKM